MSKGLKYNRWCFIGMLKQHYMDKILGHPHITPTEAVDHTMTLPAQFLC